MGREAGMDRPHLRPRVELIVAEPIAEVAKRLEARLGETRGIEGRVRRQAMLLWIGADRRRWWSPCLDVNFEPHAEGTRISGRYCPHPKLMTAYAFAAILLTFLGIFAAAWAYVQHIMGELPQCLGGTAISAVVGASLFGLHRYGTARAASQMHELGVVLEAVVPRSPGAPAQ